MSCTGCRGRVSVRPKVRCGCCVGVAVAKATAPMSSLTPSRRIHATPRYSSPHACRFTIIALAARSCAARSLVHLLACRAPVPRAALPFTADSPAKPLRIPPSIAYTSTLPPTHGRQQRRSPMSTCLRHEQYSDRSASGGAVSAPEPPRLRNSTNGMRAVTKR